MQICRSCARYGYFPNFILRGKPRICLAKKQSQSHNLFWHDKSQYMNMKPELEVPKNTEWQEQISHNSMPPPQKKINHNDNIKLHNNSVSYLLWEIIVTDDKHLSVGQRFVLLINNNLSHVWHVVLLFSNTYMLSLFSSVVNINSWIINACGNTSNSQIVLHIVPILCGEGSTS